MKRRKGTTHAIGFDLEHWHQATLIGGEVANPVDRIEESTELVLDVLDRNGTRATFFVVGTVAAEYPELVHRIGERGHELASHGHTHTTLFGRTPEWFERELSASRDAIEEAAGMEPVGFRAPNFSITRETAWAFPVLESSGFRYDSSVFPVRTPLYGVQGAPTRPYVVDRRDPFGDPGQDDADGGLMEFPLSVLGSRLRIPIAGGFYVRLGPLSLLEYGLARCEARGSPGNLYFHPWEFNPAVKTDVPPIHKRLVSFHGIERLESKVDRLLRRFDFGSVGDVLDGLSSSGTSAAPRLPRTVTLSPEEPAPDDET